MHVTCIMSVKDSTDRDKSGVKFEVRDPGDSVPTMTKEERDKEASLIKAREYAKCVTWLDDGTLLLPKIRSHFVFVGAWYLFVTFTLPLVVNNVLNLHSCI